MRGGEKIGVRPLPLVPACTRVGMILSTLFSEGGKNQVAEGTPHPLRICYLSAWGGGRLLSWRKRSKIWGKKKRNLELAGSRKVGEEERERGQLFFSLSGGSGKGLGGCCTASASLPKKRVSKQKMCFLPSCQRGERTWKDISTQQLSISTKRDSPGEESSIHLISERKGITERAGGSNLCKDGGNQPSEQISFKKGKK